MSLPKFDDIIAKFPTERTALTRLSRLIESGKHFQMTLDHLVLELEPQSVETLVRILEQLSAAGVLKRLYRVESPGTKAPIDDYTNYEDIPDRVEDWHTGRELEVTPMDLRVIYAV